MIILGPITIIRLFHHALGITLIFRLDSRLIFQSLESIIALAVCGVLYCSTVLDGPS